MSNKERSKSQGLLPTADAAMPQNGMALEPDDGAALERLWSVWVQEQDDAAQASDE